MKFQVDYNLFIILNFPLLVLIITLLLLVIPQLVTEEKALQLGIFSSCFVFFIYTSLIFFRMTPVLGLIFSGGNLFVFNFSLVFAKAKNKSLFLLCILFFIFFFKFFFYYNFFIL